MWACSTTRAFRPSPGFNAAINPGGVKTLVVRQRNNTWLYAVSGVCAAVALCVGIYMLAGDSLFGGVSVVDGSDAGPVAATVTGDSTQLAQPVSGDSLSAAAAVTPAAEGAAAQQTAVSAQSAPAATATPSALTAEETAAVSADYRFWVVAGVFSTEQNASRALEQAAKYIKDMDGRIVPFKGKFIAAVYGSDKRTDCNAFAKSYSDIYPDLWIYEVK